MKALQAPMTPEEVAEMELLAKGQVLPDLFRLAYRCGFLAGKVSTLTAVINYSNALDGTTTRSEGQPSDDGEERVEAPGAEGHVRSMYGKREDEAPS